MRLIRAARPWVRLSSSQARSGATPQEILQRALQKVPHHGWKESLTLAIRESGYSDQAVSIYPDGEYDLVRFYLKTQLAALKDVQLSAPSVLGRVEELTRARLQANTTLGRFLPQAVEMLATPRYLPLSLRSLSDLSDEIWFLAGDQSTDFSWYTRRSALSAIYLTSEVYMSEDHSKDHRDTMALLARELRCLGDVETAEANVYEWAKFNGIAVFNVVKSLTR